MSTGIATADLLDTIGGLPVHPLVVHVAVVLLPLSALALIAIVAVPRWRQPFGWVTMGGVAVGTLAAVAATSSGEALAERVGEPERHADLGETTEIVALALLLAAVVWFLLQRRASTRAGGAGGVLGQGVRLVAAIAVIALAVGVTGLTVAVGHSGAQAVWEGRIASTTAEDPDDDD